MHVHCGEWHQTRNLSGAGTCGVAKGKIIIYVCIIDRVCGGLLRLFTCTGRNGTIHSQVIAVNVSGIALLDCYNADHGIIGHFRNIHSCIRRKKTDGFCTGRRRFPQGQEFIDICDINNIIYGSIRRSAVSCGL